MIANKFNQAFSLFNQTYNYEKLFTNALEVSIFTNIAQEKIKHNKQVYLHLYKIKIADQIMFLAKYLSSK